MNAELPNLFSGVRGTGILRSSQTRRSETFVALPYS
jgi:hypothetical protein